MDTLPQELIDRISSYLTGHDLRMTLPVCRKFQYAAEQASGKFAFFAFKTHTDTERQKFLALFGGDGRRFRYLRNVHVHTSVPPVVAKPDGVSEPCRETLEELKRKDEVFSEQIRSVWASVHAAEQINADSSGKIEVRIYTPMQIVGEDFCEHRSYSSWRVHLLSPRTLPELHSVRALSICNPDDRVTEGPVNNCKLDLRVIVDLAGQLPHLEYLGCRLGIDEWVDARDPIEEHHMHDFPGCRRDARSGFAAAVQTVRLPTSLRVVQLDFINEIHKSVQEQVRQMPDLVAPRSFDPFSSSLRILSHSLRRMDLHVLADKTLFWPCDGGTPSWPNMESLAVLFHIAAPSGEWYFQSPLGEGKNDVGLQIGEDTAYPSFDEEHDEEWCYRERDSYPYARCTFRVVPIDENLTLFLDAFARAAANMPKLVEAWLWAPLSFNPEDMSEEGDSEIMELYEGLQSGWGIVYDTPGALDTSGNGVTTTRRIRWRVGPWRPSSELRQSFRRIGEQQHGPELEESWHESGGTDALMERAYFDDGTICPDRDEYGPGVYPSYSRILWNIPK